MSKKSKIAIIGRPNVGKSTLFNKLCGRRTSIVNPTAGVTRDRVYASGEWLDKKFDVIDTGGFVDSDEDVFNEKIREQVVEAVKESDSIIFLVDGKDGLNPNDQYLAKIVRQSDKKYVLAVNKCDTPEQLKNNTISFFDLGLGDPIGISALNGSGVGDVLDILLEEFDSSKGTDTSESFSISIVGMPNVGKSSLLNSIIQKEQAIVSDVAGTTRDSIDTNIQWHGRKVKIVDTAGLRKTSKVDTDIEFYSSLRAMDSLTRSDIVLFVIDADKGFTKQDKTIANHIIKEGHATTEDLDRAIQDGPGLRWSLMGTFLTFHLAGGKSGMKHMLDQFGPALKLPWTKLKAPKLSNKLINRLVEGTKKQSKGKSVEKISTIRDQYLLDLILMRKKYEKKLR